MTTTPTTSPTVEELAARVGWPHESGMRLCGEKDIAAAIRQHSAGKDRQIEALTAENERLEATFDLRHKADARAIKQWQEVTGRTMSMPDQADLCVFLMMALDMSEARATTAEAALAAVTAERDASRERERKLTEALEKCAAAFEQPLTGIEEAALNAARAASPAAESVLTDDIIRAALQEAWNDYCDDAQAFPDCFRIERGPKLFADFSRCSNFILSVRLSLEAALRGRGEG